MMNKILLASMAALCLLCLAATANAAPDQTTTSTINATVGVVFSIEWEENGEYVAYPGPNPVLSFAVDPSSNLNLADNHKQEKSDIALICTSNENKTWGLKTSSAGTLPGTNILYYLGQPTVDSKATSGVLANPTPAAQQPWPVIPQANVIYTSGDDNINTPFGTYCGMALGINGSGLAQGNYSSTITFTMTQNL